MHTVLSNKTVKARKEYPDACMDHLDFGIIKLDEYGKRTVDMDYAKQIGLTEDEVRTIQEFCDKRFRILPGELHKYQSGVYDGEFYSARYSIAVSDILTKYDLWYED